MKRPGSQGKYGNQGGAGWTKVIIRKHWAGGKCPEAQEMIKDFGNHVRSLDFFLKAVGHNQTVLNGDPPDQNS